MGFRKRVARGLRILAAAALLCAGWWLAPGQAQSPQAFLLQVDEIIGPASSDFIIRGIEKAEKAQAKVVILKLNTPGGLDTAMRDIIQKILASRVPVVVWVAPAGARAASAGTYILYASHIAVMAPATNIGAATPVQIAAPGMPGGEKPKQEPKKTKDADKSKKGSEKKDETKQTEQEPPSSDNAMRRKIVNDAVAYIRGLAKMRKRNEKWAEKAVREAVSITAEDALKEKIIDFIANDTKDLLTKLDGRKVEIAGNKFKLETVDLLVTTLEPDWRTKLLSIITNPNVAYILMMLGVYGLFFELYSPGSIFPGVTGAICLLLALYAFQVLPVNYAGVALVLLGIMLLIAELFMPSFGALGIGGIASFIIGSIILMDTDVEAYQVSLPLIISVAVTTAVLMFGVVILAVRQRRRPVVSGREQMIGDIGIAEDNFDSSGMIRVHGELWKAVTIIPVTKDQRVKVTEMDGLTLKIEPLED